MEKFKDYLNQFLSSRSKSNYLALVDACDKNRESFFEEMATDFIFDKPYEELKILNSDQKFDWFTNGKVNYLKTILKYPNQKTTFINKDIHTTYSSKELVEHILGAAQYLKQFKNQENERLAFIVESRELGLFYGMAAAALSIPVSFIYHNFPLEYKEILVKNIKPNKIFVEKIIPDLPYEQIIIKKESPKSFTMEDLNEYATDTNKALMFVNTSGSTSSPKVLSQGTFATLNFVRHQIELLLNSTGSVDKKYCNYCNLDSSWTMAIMCFVWTMILNGNDVVWDDLLTSFSDPERLNAIQKKYNCSSTYGIPSFFLIPPKSEEKLNFTNYMLGGEVITKHMFNEIKKRTLPEALVSSMYGQTEIGGGMLTRTYDGGIKEHNHNSYHLMPFAKAIVKNEELMLYKDHPPLLKNILNGKDMWEQKWEGDYFKTMDLVEMTADNDYIIKGRKDGLVRIKSRYADFNKIENDTLDQLQTRIKLLKDDDIFGMMVEGDKVKEVSEFIIKNFGKYVLPSTIKVVERIPLNMQGKVDMLGVRKIFNQK